MDTATANPWIEAASEVKRELALGDSLYDQGQYRAALEHYAQAARLRPALGEAHFKIAMSAWKLGDIPQANVHFTEAIKLNPQHPMVHEALAQYHLSQGRIEQALEHSATALQLRPAHPSFLITRANVLASNAQHQEAYAALAPLLASGMIDGRLAWAYGQVAPRIGQELGALSVLGRVLQSASLAPGEKPALHYMAAGLLDRVGRFDLAFDQARRANAAARRPFDPAGHSAWVSRIIEFFSAERMASLPRAAHGNRRPIFIVGMPRSGTSLVEQIISSHPAVFGAGELPFMAEVIQAGAAADSAEGRPFPEFLDLLTREHVEELASQYLSRLAQRNADATYVTDKMPQNFFYLGTIELLLTGCHVIHCQRDPRDTCVSCYFTDFSVGNEFSFEIAHVASYWRDYRRLMDHWKNVLKVPILDVGYEDVVADKETQTRRMLEFLDLSWDPSCLEFHQNKRYVTTASREQVRRPIYTSSVSRWKNYEKFIRELLPLVDTLNTQHVT